MKQLIDQQFLLFPALILALTALIRVVKASWQLQEGEEVLRDRLTSFSTRDQKYYTIVQKLHTNQASKKEILTLEILAIKNAELMNKHTRKLLLEGITQSDFESRKLYLKKLFEYPANQIEVQEETILSKVS